MNTPPLLEVRDLIKHFPPSNHAAKDRPVRAVDGISFTLGEGETLGLVGESGSGKSTAGRALLRLIEPTAGEVLYRGENLLNVPRERMRMLRKEMQIIFQDPFAAVNPRRRLGNIVEEPFEIHGVGRREERRDKARKLLKKVGLSEDHMERYPHELSGGQLQRVGIARAIALNPRLIVADEPVSSLDVSIQAQVINLLSGLRRSLGIAFLFISHDMAVVEHFCDRVAVMYLGKIVEIAPRERLYAACRHPYTEALLSSIPTLDAGSKNRKVIQGEVPSAAAPPAGCAFHTRCPIREKRCQEETPALRQSTPGHFTACFLRE